MQTFAQFMEDALYGPDGYYSAGHAQTGKRGDYFTAPETGEVFGQLLANIFEQWRAQFAVKSFHVVEAGAGASPALPAGGRAGEATTYHVVERSAARREKMKKLNLPVKIYGDLSEIKNAPIEGIIFGNELIDAFPVHRVRMKDGKLEEAYIEANSKFKIKNSKSELSSRETILNFRFSILNWRTPSTPRLAAYFDRLKIILPEGYETEVNLAMGDWIRQAANVLERGFVVLIDYGRPAWDYYAEERSQGTLRGFKDHRVFGIPELLSEGSQADWTADVDFTSLALDAKETGLKPLAFMEMGTFLKLGMRNLEFGIRNAAADLSDSNSAFRIPHSALKYLLHPEGLGAQFHVLILGKNIDSQEWIFDHNRLARLGLPS